MSDLAEAPLSTEIDAGPSPSAAGAGTPALEPVEVEKPGSVRDDLEKVFANETRRNAEAAKKEAKPAEEAKAPEKVEPKADEVKAEPKVADEEKPADETKGETDEQAAKREQQEKSEKRHVAAPKEFLPKAQELWRNAPREVQTEVERVVGERDAQIATLRQHTERYESIREFDELAKSNGRDLKDSLLKLNHVENMLKTNPIAGLNEVLKEIGPRKADGQPVSLFEVAQHIVDQGPQGYQQIVAHAQQQQQPQVNPEVARLQEENTRLHQQHIHATIIEPFARENPRYLELQPQIASFLKSDMIPTSLSPIQRLEAAYDMAERIYPPSRSAPSTDAGLESTRRADDDFSGSKSIKSAPGSVSEDVETVAKGDESSRDSILAEIRRLNRA